MKYIFTICLFALMTTSLLAAGKMNERDYQHRYCAGMALEFTTKSGARADCVSRTHAIEVEFSKDWAEAIGQSLHYASELHKRAGIVIVCKKNQAKCTSHSLRLASTIKAKASKLPIDVWYCKTTDLKLADCVFEEAEE